jgi:hypothetical protein
MHFLRKILRGFYMLNLWIWWIWRMAAIAAATVVNQESIVVSLSDSGMVRREKLEKWSQKWHVKCETTKGDPAGEMNKRKTD